MIVKTEIAAIIIIAVAMLPTPIWAAVHTKNLVAGYRFEEPSGTGVADMSGNARTGTATGTTIVTGHNGRGRSFNGTSDKISIADNAALRLGTFTLAAWVKLTATPTNGQKMVMIEKDDTSGNANYALSVENNNNCSVGLAWEGWFQDSSGAVYDNCYAVTMSTGTWYFVVGTWDSTNLKLYINGVLEKTTNQSGHTPTTGTGVLMLGNEAGNAFWFNGVLDEARVYNRALTATEVRALMLGYEPSEF